MIATRYPANHWPSEAKARYRMLISAMPTQDTGLWGLVDCAIDESIYNLCLAEPEASQARCLFDGYPAIRLGNTSPWLILLHENSPLLERWLTDGWHAHWGIFLTARQLPDKLKRHLKKFLWVTTAQKQRVYFRYFDPRVLRTSLPHWQPGHASDFYSDVVEQYFALAQDGKALLRFSPKKLGVLHNLAGIHTVQAERFVIKE